jgi:hypothetical protein
MAQIPNLRHQSSAATIKSSDRIEGADLYASTSTSATARPESRATASREEGQNKSAVYEQEIQRMRSESRLGNHDEEKSFSRSSIQQGTDATDTSGTEGSGPIVENRRRKKSSASSSSKRAAARAAGVRDGKERTSPQKDRVTTANAGPKYSGRDPYATTTSPLRTESAMEFNAPSRFPPPRRAPLASAFMPSRYRSDDPEYEVEQRRNISDVRGEMWSRGEELPPIDRRRRHVSDAMPSSEASSQQGRMAVDTSGVSKHLGGRASRYGTLAESSNPQDWSDRSSSRSVSEVIRPRKISTSSSLSQRSSGGASELHRTASRASLRKSHGKDVFDDGGIAPPLPNHGGHSLSPRHLAPDQIQQQTLAMAQALKQKQERLRETGMAKGEDWRREVEDLQARIDQLAMNAAVTSSQVEGYSRSSSRASAFAPRSSHSNVSSTPSLGRRPTNRPSTEPRLPRTDNGRAPSETSSGHLRYETSSRLGLRESERRLPVTPNMTESRVTSSRMSGVLTGATPHSTGRFSSLGQSGNRSLSASSSAGPLHERNLLNSFEIFERYLLDSTSPLEPSSISPRSASEAVELINRFKETSDTAITINAGLRMVLQNVLELQIDAEVGDSAADNARLFADIDRSLSSILRDSDEQIRSLTDGLITFTRAEKERDRLRKKRNDVAVAATIPRSGSRLSSLGLSQISPGKERLLGRESQQGKRETERRSSSFDLRRSMSIRDRLTASNSNTSMQAVESRSDRSNGSRKSSDSGKQSRLGRRFSLLHETSPGTSTTSNFPPSPYSPSPNPASSGDNASRTSPTLDMHHSASEKHRLSRLSHNMSHARSFSELSPKVRSTVDAEILMQRSPLLRRDKSSTNSVQTVRAPSSLSPRRSRLSFPRVSATNVNATTMAGGGVSGEDDHSSASESRNGHDLEVYNEETRSLFQSLGRSRGLQVSRDM